MIDLYVLTHPEDDDDYIPEMPENYGAEYLDKSIPHQNIEDMFDDEVDGV